MIGETPAVNPANYSIDPSNDFILQFLYRGLIRYNIQDHKLEGDLASCDLSRNFATIECNLRGDGVWSDGSHVSKEDVLGTYDFLKNTDTNPELKQLLANIDISTKGDSLIFSGKNADMLILDALMIPIIRKSDIESIKKQAFDPAKASTSGPYVYAGVALDDQAQSKKILIQKNEKVPTDKVYIGKYTFRFFNDSKTLLKYEDSLGMIYAPKEPLSESPKSLRFTPYRFLLPQYVSLFLNSEKLGVDLRTAILQELGEMNLPLSSEREKVISDPFFGTGNTTPVLAKEKNLTSILRAAGFYKKEELADVISKKLDTAIKNQTAAEFGMNIYFKTPTTKQVFFTDKKEILLSGNATPGVSGVFVNDYRLKSFNPGNTKFYFKANFDMKTLKDGQNTYTLYFEIDKKKVRKEVLTVYRSDDANWLKQKEDELKKTLEQKRTKTTGSNTLKNEKETTLKKIQALDTNRFYDTNLVPFTILLDYSTSQPTIENIKK